MSRSILYGQEQEEYPSIEAGVSWVCSGSVADISTKSYGQFDSDCLFYLLLSDGEGKFDKPDTIDVSNLSQSLCGFIKPMASGNYLLKVISTSPVVESNTVSVSHSPPSMEFSMEDRALAYPFTTTSFFMPALGTQWKAIWDFGDSTQLVSADKMVQHQYLNNGIFKVSVELFSNGCRYKDQIPHSIQVSDIPKGKLGKVKNFAKNFANLHYGLATLYILYNYTGPKEFAPAFH